MTLKTICLVQRLEGDNILVCHSSSDVSKDEQDDGNRTGNKGLVYFSFIPLNCCLIVLDQARNVEDAHFSATLESDRLVISARRNCRWLEFVLEALFLQQDVCKKGFANSTIPHNDEAKLSFRRLAGCSRCAKQETSTVPFEVLRMQSSNT